MPDAVSLPFWRRLGLAALGGVAAEMAAPPVDAWPLAFAALALFAFALRGMTPGKAALIGLAWGSVYYLLHLRWALVATNVLPWLALALLQTSFVVLTAVVVAIAFRSTLAQRYPVWSLAIVLGATWSTADLLRGYIPFGGFPWGSLAVSQVDAPLKSLAWLGGTSLLTFALAVLAIILLSGCAAICLRSYRQGAMRLGAVVVVMALTAIVPLQTAAENGTLRIGAVQGNVPDPGQTPDSDVAWRVFMNHVDATRDLLARPDAQDLDLIMWPEDGAMTDLTRWHQAAEALQELVDEAQTPIMLGTQEYPADGGRFNLVVLWEPERGEVARYAKQHPVPFGEYIPMRGFFRIFSDQVDRVTTDMRAGTEPALIEVDVTSLGRAVGIATVICFEIAYRDIVHEAVELGAEVIFVPTNNASFGRTPEAWQQLGLTRLAAIQYGRSAIQVSTVGVSAVVLADGSIVHETGHFTTESLVADVPLRTSRTPAMVVGHGINVTFGVIAVVAIALGLVESRRREQTSAASKGAERNVTERDE